MKQVVSNQERYARRYTPKVKKRVRKRKQLHKCVEKFTKFYRLLWKKSEVSRYMR